MEKYFVKSVGTLYQFNVMFDNILSQHCEIRGFKVINLL